MARETRFPQEMAYLLAQGIASICALPLTTPQRRVGMLLAGTREPHVYDGDDLTFLSSAANQVALSIDNALSHDAIQAALHLERERIRNLDASDALLRALLPVLEIREVFPRISEIANTVLPHDLLTLMFHDGTGEIAVRAASRNADELGTRLTLAQRSLSDDAFTIVDDVEQANGLVADPPDFWQRVRAAGYRSVLIVRARTDAQLLALNFWSKTPRAFAASDVPVARRIADHVTVCVAHERLAEVARQAAEERLRAEQLERRVKSLSDELAVRVGHGGMVGPSAEWQAVLKAATQVAATDTTVLVVGESGTGKEVVPATFCR